MEIILIGNYRSDRQESMLRFAQMLHDGFKKEGIRSEIWQPKAFFGAWFKYTNKGLGKLMGYIDKFLLFPLILKWRLLNRRFDDPEIKFHICDHGNAPYQKLLPVGRVSITCHDVLAIRGALGDEQAYTPASFLGFFYQKWILENLLKAEKLICVSKHTLHQLKVIGQERTSDSARDWRVIHNGFNANFGIIPHEERDRLLAKSGLDPQVPFLLYVGSGSARKNRNLLVFMADALKGKWQGNVVLAGEDLNDEIITYANILGVADKIISVKSPNHNLLRALYNGCQAFVFPSFCEGFGWPLIEAQACGAPVITSSIDPMPEVTGNAALFADPNSPLEFAEAFLYLQDEGFRMELIRKGFENVQRFKTHKMIQGYLNVHQSPVITSEILQWSKA